MALHITIDPAGPDPAVLQQAADCIRRGGIVVHPTETLYGIGAHGMDRSALERVARLKGRAGDSPFLLLISDIAALDRVARNISPQALALARRYWPGPLTILFTAAPGLSPAVTGAAGTVGCRISPHPFARALPAAAGAPVISTSANIAGGPNPSRLADVPDALLAGADMVIDGGPTAGSTPSTIVDATGIRLRLIRRGALDIPGITP
jgi:L-threonylcarbamoyladenylate synthase